MMTILMAGCLQPIDATVGNSSVVISPTAKRVGYLVNVRPYPTHTHLGTTALTNFTKEYPFAWQIPTYIEQELARRLTRLGIKAINLRKEGLSPKEVNGLVKNVNGIWMVARGKANTYNNLANRLGLSAIVVINESSKIATKDCGILGCKEIKVSGYGLLTQSFVNSNKFYSATPFFAHIYKLKPLASMDNYLKKINEDREMTLVATSVGSKVNPNKIGFIYPKNFNRWSEEELKPLRAPLMRYIENMSQLIVEVVRDTL
jgi:hypothetical protein